MKKTIIYLLLKDLKTNQNYAQKQQATIFEINENLAYFKVGDHYQLSDIKTGLHLISAKTLSELVQKYIDQKLGELYEKHTKSEIYKKQVETLEKTKKVATRELVKEYRIYGKTTNQKQYKALDLSRGSFTNNLLYATIVDTYEQAQKVVKDLQMQNKEMQFKIVEL